MFDPTAMRKRLRQRVKQASSPDRPCIAMVEGDGVKGPKGMVWVLGGDFLPRSDHKLAQRTERCTASG
jgi:hypothetical protein